MDRLRGRRLGPAMGKEVALVEAASVPLERVLGAEVGAMFGALHAEHGVELHLGVGVEGFRGQGSVEEVMLADGTAVAGDLFVVGVGVTPRTELVEDAGIELDNGIVVDEYLSSSLPGIWAAGDVANAYHPIFGAHIRLEHWSAALNQGPVAAKNMLGQRVAYQKIPYFFSDQYDLGMEYQRVCRHLDDRGLSGAIRDAGRSSSSGSARARCGRHERERVGRRRRHRRPRRVPAARGLGTTGRPGRRTGLSVGVVGLGSLSEPVALGSQSEPCGLGSQ